VATAYAPQREFDVWERAARAGTREGFDAYTRQFPAGRYLTHAKARLALLAGGAPPPAPEPLNKGPRPLALAREP
jgi:hypothetical protein